MMMIHWASAATAPELFFSSEAASSVVVESAVETSMASAGAPSASAVA